MDNSKFIRSSWVFLTVSLRACSEVFSVQCFVNSFVIGTTRPFSKIQFTIPFVPSLTRSVSMPGASLVAFSPGSPKASQCLLIVGLFLCAFGVQGPKTSMSFVWMDSLICPGINLSTANQIIPICSLNQTIFMGFGLFHLSRVLNDPFSHPRIEHIFIKPREMWCLLKIKCCP